MAKGFHLQITDEMQDYLLSAPAEYTSQLIKILLRVAKGGELDESSLDGPMRHVAPIFAGQVQRFRAAYEEKKRYEAERKRQQRSKMSHGTVGTTWDNVGHVGQRGTGGTTWDRRDNVGHVGQTGQRGTVGTTWDKADITDNVGQLGQRGTVETQRNALDTSEDACPHPNHTNPNHTNPYQTRPESTDSESVPNSKSDRLKKNRKASALDFGFGVGVGVENYHDFFRPEFRLIDWLLVFCAEARPRVARRGYEGEHRRIGEEAFRSECVAFWNEVYNHDEEPRNRGAALMARLAKYPDYDYEAAAEVAALCDKSFAEAREQHERNSLPRDVQDYMEETKQEKWDPIVIKMSKQAKREQEATLAEQEGN